MPMSREQLDLVKERYLSVSNMDGTLAHFLPRSRPVHKKEIKQSHAAKKTASFNHAP
jgi:hypothetical protein